MTHITIEGQRVELGEGGSVDLKYHSTTSAEAALAVREVSELLAVLDLDWRPTFKSSGSTVWAEQAVRLGDEEGAALNVTIFFPREVTHAAPVDDLTVARAKEFATRVITDALGEPTDHSALHEEAERERLDGQYYGPDWDGQS